MDTSRNQQMPRARHEELLVHELADEVLVYDLKHHKAHSLNKTAALVWQGCDGKTDVSAISQFLEKQLGTSVDEDVVELALRQLDRAGLLRERASRAVNTRVSRRELMRTMGLASAVSLPLVVSIFAPTSAQAQSVACQPAGQPCASQAECCPGLNCTGPNFPKTCKA